MKIKKENFLLIFIGVELLKIICLEWIESEKQSFDYLKKHD